MRRIGLLVLALTMVGGACSVEDTLRAPYCEGESSGMIAAQSVPSAEFVPCITELPDGWEITSVRVNQNGTRLRLDSDRAGTDAAVFRYEEACEIGDAVSVPFDDDRIERYDDSERIDPNFRSKWFYRFSGGCWWWQFDFDDGASATLAVEVADSFSWIARDELQKIFADSFLDEDL